MLVMVVGADGAGASQTTLGDIELDDTAEDAPLIRPQAHASHADDQRHPVPAEEAMRSARLNRIWLTGYLPVRRICCVENFTQGIGTHQAVDCIAGRQIGDLQSHDEEQYGLPDAIKLGLGDFIFYSMLVARAAMYDMLTVFASYLAIVAGLGATLLLLALYRKALPALPISIALGVAFYFLARALLEPFVLPLSMHLLYF